MYIYRHEGEGQEGARDEEREKSPWVCEGEKGPGGQGEGEHSLKAYSHLGCSEAWKKRGGKMD